ncbi:MAG TPA: V-type ATPase 116kDa subunit family protein [Lachnospiraceae bacterium]|nr:V-type ATPase 116kDa subunit family protein [Lachnospiraceae bacterium]
MIVKMKFLSLTGPKADIDRIVNKYLSKYEIHLENALTELSTVQNLTPYIQTNPYKELLSKANEYSALVQKDAPVTPAEISLTDSIDLITELDGQLTDLNRKKSDLESKASALADSMQTIQPFREIHYNLKSILDFHFIDFRFGKIPKEYLLKFESYVYDNFNTIFYECDADENYVWGVYFSPKEEAHKIDAVYSSMHFERIFIPDEYHGTPDEAYSNLNQSYEDLLKQIEAVGRQMAEILKKDGPALLGARNRLNSLSQNFDVRKMAACTKAQTDTFYILCGWMAEDDIENFQKDIADDTKVFCVVQGNGKDVMAKPPTKLKNPKIFKPYEMYVKMYGLPNYREMDPTIFVAITYSFIFGIMFGDAGQGICLMIGGLLLYKYKHVALAGIIAAAGVFSTFFGIMFGSFFGFENVIPAVWLKPKTAMSKLPGIGSINTIMVCAVAFGMFLILLTMILHIINAIRQHDTMEKFFDTNSLAGFVFYGSIVVTIVLLMTGHSFPAVWMIIVFFVLPLIVMFCKEPLTKLVDKRKGKLVEGGVGMFIVQGFFEMFEVLLSYFSNTLSFVRIGAFAVSHAAMMGVVLMLAGAENGGSPNWIAIVLGNLFVMGMEGLIVGIQVLRLEYYEMFSRFYKGDGKPFTPFLKKKE